MASSEDQDPPPKAPEPGAEPKPSPATNREARLAAALRANLRRRKSDDK